LTAPSASDESFVRRCLALAQRAEGRTTPNPIVGAVVVSPTGEVLSEGFHQGPASDHAEAAALRPLGFSAPGATLYVSLEPCAHPSPRKPRPCADLVIASGVRRLVYGLADPFPGHGGGAARVAAAGIEVTGPVLPEACAAVNAPFLTFARAGRAHATLKAAMTLDGKIATRAGESRWITGPEARADAHRWRDRLDAILVGAGTVLADDPLLTVRGVAGGRDPVRVILDGRLRVPAKARLFHSGSPARTLVATTRDAPARRALALERVGAQVLRLPGKDGKLRPEALLRALAKAGLLSVLVEGGAETHAAFLAAGMCDRLLLYVAPRAVGGQAAPGWLGGDGVAKLARAHAFRFAGPPHPLGDDLLLTLAPKLLD
jgi:diaminohydroxyphosphoribosylaminopyrimidine deaminase/5-amino-6-(5-phosphoribosylamino)uracil reductase